MKPNASILAIGCSATGGNHIPCLEADALFVADNFKMAYDRFPKFPKYSVRKWGADIITGRVIDYREIIKRILSITPRKTVMVYISSHGFKKEIDGKVHECYYFGDRYNWLPAIVILQALNKLCENPKIERVQLVSDCCFSGAIKKDIRVSDRISAKYAKSLKNMLQPKAIKIRNAKVPEIALPKKIKLSKKISLLNVCKGNQTSFAEFSPDDMAPVTTSGHSLGTNSWITAMNFYYSYAPGLNLTIQGRVCKPRSTHAIMTLAQRRVNETIKTIGLREWLQSYPPTTFQKFNNKGKLIFY